MTKLRRALFKYKNKINFGWEKYCTTLKFTQIRSRVEKGGVLGWTPSYILRKLLIETSGIRTNLIPIFFEKVCFYSHIYKCGKLSIFSIFQLYLFTYTFIKANTKPMIYFWPGTSIRGLQAISILWRIIQTQSIRFQL